MNKAQREIYNRVYQAEDPGKELRLLIDFILDLHFSFIDGDKLVSVEREYSKEI